MSATKVTEFLDHNDVGYVSIMHSRVFTAPEVAEFSHVKSRDFAKTVVVKIDDVMAMVVVPADRRILLGDLRQWLASESVRLATEAELREAFPDCEVGAMPPFGNLYGMLVYVASALAEEKEIAFNAGTFSEVIKLAFDDFERLVRPMIIDFVTAA